MDHSLWLTLHLRHLSQTCGCSQLTSSLVGRGLLPERSDQLRSCLEVSFLWCQQDWALSAVNWYRCLQPGLNLLPLCPQLAKSWTLRRAGGVLFSKPSFGTQKPCKKMELVHPHKTKEDIFAQLYFSTSEQKSCSRSKITLNAKRAFALKAVD